MYTRNILLVRCRVITYTDTSAILNLSLQGQQSCPILLRLYFKMALTAREDRDCVLQDLKNAPKFHMRTTICSYFIYLIFRHQEIHEFDVTTQVLSAFFNTCQIDHCFSCILHFRGHHQCHVVRSCFIYRLVMSTKLAFLNLQNSKCKYSPMPSEFQFIEPPPPPLPS